jgi:DNA-binding NarL/FixJ family response regulator
MLESVRLRCLIVDDNHSFLHASRALLETQGITVVGVATTAVEALQRAEELGPDIILVDVELGADDGFELARKLDLSVGAIKEVLRRSDPAAGDRP